MSSNPQGWTVLLVRRDGTETRQLDGRRWIAAGLAALVVVGTLGLTAGRYWEQRGDDARIGRLEAELRQANAARDEMERMAARLEEIETDYDRIRRALGSDLSAPGSRVILPRSAPAEPAVTATDGVPVWPLVEGGFITRTFGSRGDANRDGHPGVDIAVPLGSYVRSAQDGLVEAAGRDSVYGYFMRIAHADATSSLYGHNSWLFAAVGDSVERFEVIALSGNTGRSTAPHLHFEIRREGVLIDPFSYVAEVGSSQRGAGTGRNGVEPR